MFGSSHGSARLLFLVLSPRNIRQRAKNRPAVKRYQRQPELHRTTR